MNWHLITSSKGGVGKTLIAMLLLACSRERHGTVLIIDLNGMNADLRRLVGAKASNKIGEENLFQLPLTATQFEREFHIEKVSLPPSFYVVSWPLEAFRIFTPDDFRTLLEKVKGELKEETENHFKCRIGTIIIDTNYHFCNLFPKEDEFYKHNLWNSFTDENSDEHLFIWFIWVYRHLKNLFQLNRGNGGPYGTDAMEVSNNAVLIERHLSKRKRKLESERNPFVHVISPNSFAEIADRSLFKKITRVAERLVNEKSRYRRIEALEALAKLKGERRSVDFNDFVGNLQRVWNQFPQQKEELASIYFHRILNKYVSFLASSGSGCPHNLVPLYSYEMSLRNFTDADFFNIVGDLSKLNIYDNFKGSYDQLLP